MLGVVLFNIKERLLCVLMTSEDKYAQLLGENKKRAVVTETTLQKTVRNSFTPTTLLYVSK
ncbi:hypothetical protein EGQ50_01135 [Coxiella endosymbiont of Amblyomma sculptum]|nr:hypothetical protein EGQ50_01135 [Coxiella endosymbiont of Amblyomma sculptum]